MPGTVEKDAHYFEQLYKTLGDPWGYRHAGEQGKYRIMVDAARRWHPQPTRVLEVACSLGYMTEMLAGYAATVCAFDISTTAVEHTRARLARLLSRTQFEVRHGNALTPDYARAQFDVIFAGDALIGAFDGGETAVQALRALLPLLTPGGVLIATDYINPLAHSSYVQLIEKSGGSVHEKLYFDDRYWFRMRGALKGLRKTAFGERLLCSTSVYRWLAHRANARGPAGSKHFGLVVQNRS